MRRSAIAVAAIGMAGLGASACTSTAPPRATSTTSASTTTTTATTAVPSSTVVLPVVRCATVYGAGSSPNPYVPAQLPATTNQSGLSIYSNGILTVLGPTGWTCSALVAADGGELLDVYRPGGKDPSTTEIAPGTDVVQLNVDYTGHGPGAELVCPLFPNSPAARFMQGSPPCPVAPAGERDTNLTTDIVTFVDPPGVRGTAEASGGNLASSGAMVYPQVGATEAPGGVTVAVLSCTLPATLASLCGSIQSDFLVRRAPTYEGSTG